MTNADDYHRGSQSTFRQWLSVSGGGPLHAFFAESYIIARMTVSLGWDLFRGIFRWLFFMLDRMNED
jgi:hypothetical protein